MRLDKFLKVSRLIKRRTVANTVSDMGRVLVNGNPSKPAKQLKVGDIIEIEYANRTEKYEVLVVPMGNVSIQEASTLYKQIKEE
jgi:ribosomal 50S subunit-recycling heat shock protein